MLRCETHTFGLLAVGVASHRTNGKLAVLEEVLGDGAASEACRAENNNDLLAGHVVDLNVSVGLDPRLYRITNCNC